MAFKFKNIQEFIRGIIEPHTKAVDTKLHSVAEGMLQNNASIREMLALEATNVTQLIKLSTSLTTLKINPDKSELLDFVYVETLGNRPTYPKVEDVLDSIRNSAYVIVSSDDPTFDNEINRLNINDGAFITSVSGADAPMENYLLGSRDIGYVANVEINTPQFTESFQRLDLKDGGIFTVLKGENIKPMEYTDTSGNFVGYIVGKVPGTADFFMELDKLNLSNGALLTVRYNKDEETEPPVEVKHSTGYVTVDKTDPSFNEQVDNLQLKENSFLSVVDGLSSPMEQDTLHKRDIGYISGVSGDNIEEIKQAISNLDLKNGSLFTLLDGEIVSIPGNLQGDETFTGFINGTGLSPEEIYEKIRGLNLTSGALISCGVDSEGIEVRHSTGYINIDKDNPEFENLVKAMNLKNSSFLTVIPEMSDPMEPDTAHKRDTGYISNIENTEELKNAIKDLDLKNGSMFTILEGNVVPISGILKGDENFTGYVIDVEDGSDKFNEEVNKQNLTNGSIFSSVKSE